MNEKKLWRQAFPMGKKGSIVVGVVAFALVVFLAWKAFRTPNDRDSLALQQEEKIRDMEDRVARLQKELDESSKQIAALQAGSNETMGRAGLPNGKYTQGGRQLA
jgi:septal ring-binding cell division protein DamX